MADAPGGEGLSGGSAGDPGAAARRVAEAAAACAARIEAERALPPDLVAEIRAGGLFRVLLPRELGGRELTLPDYLPLIETVAAADASTAWCINQAAVFATLSVRMPPAGAAEVWADPAAVVANGPPGAATATAVPGGWRLRGRWKFSSGCRHATWVAAAAPVQQPDGTRTGLRILLLPPEDVEFEDVWDVRGLRGTGSFDFRADDVFVPEQRAIDLDAAPRVRGPLYELPVNLLFAAGFGSVAVGNARAARDEALALLVDKRPVNQRQTMRDEGWVQLKLGEATALLDAGRAYLHASASRLWQEGLAGAVTMDARIGLRLAATHAIRSSAQAVEAFYSLCGSDAIFTGGPLQRRFQDAHTITQQVQGRLAHYATAGQHMLGLAPEPRLF